MTEKTRSVHDVAMERLLEWYDRPVIQNAIRSAYVEFQIHVLLGEQWKHVGRDWGGWDFERNGVRLEVKQSAALQSWHREGQSSKASFDIASRTGRYEGADWIDEPGRSSDIYVFAWHGVHEESCDHRDENQWVYYVVESTLLPDQKTISLGPLERLAEGSATAATSADLARVVDETADRVQRGGSLT